ncbi:MAG: hypothetical protein AB2A00_41420, partial [Myxococcota bacterium]
RKAAEALRAPPGDAQAQLKKAEEERERRKAEHAVKVKAARKKAAVWRVVCVVAAVALLLYSALALILFLRSNSAWSMLALPAAFQLLRADPGGVMRITGLIVVANTVRFLADLPAVHSKFALAVPAAFLKGLATLAVYGLCGLYIRQNARVLSVRCDDDDWEPIPFDAAPAPAAAPVKRSTATNVAAPAPSPVAAPARTSTAVPAPPSAAPSASTSTAAAATSAGGVMVYECRFAGRGAQGLNVQSMEGRSMVLQPSQVRAVGAGMVAIGGTSHSVLVTDVVMHSQPPNVFVLRFLGHQMGLDTLAPPGTPPQQIYQALMAELALVKGVLMWPSASVLQMGAYPTFPDLGVFERSFREAVMRSAAPAPRVNA